MLITIQDLQKQLKSNKTKQCFDSCPRLKNAVKNNTESRFPCGVIKKCTHAPNANPHKLVEKTIETWSRVVYKRHVFERCPQLKNAVKNSTKSKIFVVRDQNMTKKDTYAPDANHDKGLAKTAETV